jgi:hypothetical protein
MSNALVTMTVWVDVKGYCSIVNALSGTITFGYDTQHPASLKRTRTQFCEVQVPIQIIGQFLVKNQTTISLRILQELEKEKSNE